MRYQMADHAFPDEPPSGIIEISDPAAPWPSGSGENHSLRHVNSNYPALPLALRPYVNTLPLSSFDLSTREGKIDAYNAQIMGDMSIDDAMDAEIEVVGYHIYVASMPDEVTGEQRPIVRTVLLGPDGTKYDGASEGIIRALSAMVVLYGRAPWTPPVRVIPRRKQNPKTRHFFHTLELVK